MYTVKKIGFDQEFEYDDGTKSVHLAPRPMFALVNDKGQIVVTNNALTNYPHTHTYSVKKDAVAACERMNRHYNETH